MFMFTLRREMIQFDSMWLIFFKWDWNRQLPLDPKTMKNEGFTPQNMGYNP